MAAHDGACLGFFSSSEMSRKPRILLGCTGSVAALNIPELIDELRRLDNEV